MVSRGGRDDGPSCARAASLPLDLGSQVGGRQSWVSGGGSYPWPLHSWADVRGDANPDSVGIISIRQDAEAQHRWRPLGDGYRPLPGDWVLFDGHVEVVTGDSGGVLHTVGGDSLPNFSVNAHEYRAPLSGAGVVGFVNNGSLAAGAGGARQDASSSGGQAAPSSAARGGPAPGGQSATSSGGAGLAAEAAAETTGGLAAIPGTTVVAAQNTGARGSQDPERGTAGARNRGARSHEAPSPMSARRAPGEAAIPGVAVPAPRSGGATGKAAGQKAATAGSATGEAGGDRAAGGKAAEHGSARPAARGDAAI